jgi:hypothetical protein
MLTDEGGYALGPGNGMWAFSPTGSNGPRTARLTFIDQLASAATGDGRDVTPTGTAGLAAPGQPTLTATAAPGSVHLSWIAPNNGGSAITKYKIIRSRSSETETFHITLGNVTS